jgi:transcription initiation factor TFIIE subunit alpha
VNNGTIVLTFSQIFHNLGLCPQQQKHLKALSLRTDINMRLTQKKIEEILVLILGEDGLPVVNKLIGRENVSEFDLANKTKKDIKVIRRMLYTLYNHNLVGFTRKKDKQKGWYIYYWTLLPDSIRFSYFKTKRELLEKLKQQLVDEQREIFFVCPTKCTRLNFDQAMDFEFHCPECAELISQDDGEAKIAALKKRIFKTEEELTKLTLQRQVRRKVVNVRKKETKAKKRVVRKTSKKPSKMTKKVMKPKKLKKK